MVRCAVKCYAVMASMITTISVIINVEKYNEHDVDFVLISTIELDRVSTPPPSPDIFHCIWCESEYYTAQIHDIKTVLQVV